MSVLLESTLCVITRGRARQGASVFPAGRTQAKCDRLADEWLRPDLSNARAAVGLAHGCTAREGTHARSCV